jgi:hypothetical protein
MADVFTSVLTVAACGSDIGHVVDYVSHAVGDSSLRMPSWVPEPAARI